MIFLDQPFVSSFLIDTIEEFELPVIATEAARAFGAGDLPSAVSEENAREQIKSAPDPKLYMVSESSIGWVAEHLSTTALPGRIEQFKNKAGFRRATSDLYPAFSFREILASEIDHFDPASFPLPFVIKPTVGFFSLGVQRVETAEAWPAALASIRAELRHAEGLFPGEVLSTASFLLEQCIEGREFAIDAYFDGDSEPVLLSVLEHLFASKDDASDRLYITSAGIVRENLERFTQHLRDLAEVFDVRGMPVHVEVRVDAAGQVIPIEVNPMRFGGWCTTADLTHHAFGVNPYASYFRAERPDWDAVLRQSGGETFALVALGNTTGVAGSSIASFDYEALLARFTSPLELRKTDFRRYPIFGFLFLKVDTDSAEELDWALQTDLREFV